MTEPKYFTFSDEDIKRYEDECEEREIQQKLKYNIENCLGNYEPHHLEIILNNITEYDTIDWNSISKNEILDDQFIYNYGKHLNWSRLIRYQKLSRVIIRKNTYFFDLYDLWDMLIKYQKLHYSIIEILYKDMSFWTLLVTYQKISQTILYKMIHKKTKYFDNSLEFNNLIIKYQLEKH